MRGVRWRQGCCICWGALDVFAGARWRRLSGRALGRAAALVVCSGHLGLPQGDFAAQGSLQCAAVGLAPVTNSCLSTQCVTQDASPMWGRRPCPH